MAEKYGCPLPEVVKKATLNPAKAMKIDADYGSIEIGKKADVLIVQKENAYPGVTGVFVDGQEILSLNYRTDETAGSNADTWKNNQKCKKSKTDAFRRADCIFGCKDKTFSKRYADPSERKRNQRDRHLP